MIFFASAQSGIFPEPLDIAKMCGAVFGICALSLLVPALLMGLFKVLKRPQTGNTDGISTSDERATREVSDAKEPRPK
jgi:hypothetical protein